MKNNWIEELNALRETAYAQAVKELSEEVGYDISKKKLKQNKKPGDNHA